MIEKIYDTNQVQSSTKVEAPISNIEIDKSYDISTNKLPGDELEDLNSEYSGLIYDSRNSEYEIEAEDYQEKSPIDFNNVRSTQKFLQKEGYDLGKYGADNVAGKKTKKAVQQYLFDSGYDIGQTELKDPIDGIIGRRTNKAISQLKKDIEGSGFEKSDEGKFGYIGECDDDQCAKTTQTELSKGFGVSREDLYTKYGVHGDAWNMFDNIIKSGGDVVYDGSKMPEKVSPGDVAQIYTGGHSDYQDEAGENNPTHVGVIEDNIMYDNTGRPFSYLKHNLHKSDFKGGYKGRLYRSKLYLDDMSVEGYRNFEVRSIARPKLVAESNRKRIQGNPNIQLVPKSDMPEVAINGANQLNDIETKTNVMRDFSLSEEEYNSIALATIGIMGQETGYGEKGKIELVSDRLELAAKELAASSIKVFTGGEASRGYARIKYDTNFKDISKDIKRKYDLSESSISVALDDGSKSALAASLILSKHYSGIKKSNPEMTAEDVMYLSIQKFNRYSLKDKFGEEKKSSVEYSKDRDLSYVNKVLMFADSFKAIDGTTKINTIIDRLNKDERIISKQVVPMIANNIINKDELVNNLLAEYKKLK